MVVLIINIKKVLILIKNSKNFFQVNLIIACTYNICLLNF